jgi:hypothetical protein
MKYKFRVWNKSKKQMEYDHDFDGGFTTLNELFEYEDFVFMRSFGHKDKNGKEMWEGDIVKVWSNTGELIFGGQTIVLSSVCPYTHPAYVEVVGNEWENPELVQLR